MVSIQASMKLSKEQVVALSSAEMVQNYLVAQKPRIADSVKQSLAVAEIFKLENLEVCKLQNSSCWLQNYRFWKRNFGSLLQVSAEELDMEVANAVEEFKRYDQEYDEARVREQVTNRMPLKVHVEFPALLFRLSIKHCWCIWSNIVIDWVNPGLSRIHRSHSFLHRIIFNQTAHRRGRGRWRGLLTL